MRIRSIVSMQFSDVHIASSCLQKALRRGELSFAFAAAQFLLRRDPEGFGDGSVFVPLKSSAWSIWV